MDAVSFVLFLILCSLLYAYFTRHKNYWRNRDVPYLIPVPILGNLKPLMLLKKSPGPFLGDLYNATQGLGHPFLGIFLFNCEPALLVKDPNLVKRILVQDFDHFHNRNVECNPGCDPIGVKNLFVIRDAKWKYLRAKLSPTFTSGKMRQMFVLTKEVVSELTKIIDEGIASEEEAPAVEFKELIAKYTTDVINSCAFGIRSNSLGDANSRFRYFGKKVFNTGIKRSLETRAFFFMHWLANTLRFVFFEKESTRFMEKVFAEILEEREKNVITRNDFVDVLIKLKKDLQHMKTEESREVWELDEEAVLAQAALFYTAGFETTSVTIMFTLYELALQPEVQDRLRREIVDSLEEKAGTLDYDTLLQLKYLDMVVSEILVDNPLTKPSWRGGTNDVTGGFRNSMVLAPAIIGGPSIFDNELKTLRKYPPMAFVDRICTKDYPIPDSDVIIKKGTPVFISLYKGLHYDAKYFPEPEKYNPDRFDDVGKATRQPYSYLPFGEGPHICLGMRFGLMNTKTAVSVILSKYRVEPCEGTPIPLEISARSIILNPKGDLFLRFVPLHSEGAA